MHRIEKPDGEDGTVEEFYWTELSLDWRRGYYDSEAWPFVASGVIPWEVARA